MATIAPISYERIIAELEFLGIEMEAQTIPDYHTAQSPEERQRRWQRCWDAYERNERRRCLIMWRGDYQLQAIQLAEVSSASSRSRFFATCSSLNG